MEMWLCGARGMARGTGTVGFAVLLCWWIGSLGGCAAVAPVATDAAGTAIDKTGDLIGRGKVESCQVASIDEATATVRKAADELDLKYEREKKHPDQLKLCYIDLRKQEIVVTVVRRTPHMTEIHVDVGLFGPESMAQLMMRQILSDLPGHGPVEPKLPPEVRGGTHGK